MNRCLALFALIVTLPVEAALLRFAMSGEFEADFDPPAHGPVELSYAPNTGPAHAIFADTLAPGGALARNYFVGTSPPAGVPFWDRARVESFDEPVLLLGDAELLDALGMIEFSQLSFSVDVDNAAITRSTPLPEPGVLALTAYIVLLFLVRTQPAAPRRPNATRRRSAPA